LINHEIATSSESSIDNCRAACDDNDNCQAFTYQVASEECILRSEASTSWGDSDGTSAAFKCDHTPSNESPDNDPDSYLWSSCANQLAQLENSPPGAYVPQCTNDGGYESEQCHGSTGFCWCVDQFGKATDGQSTFGSVPGGCSGITYPSNY